MAIKSAIKNYSLSNVSALQFFQLVRYGAFIVIGILLSKSALGTANIGHYETFLLIATAFSLFWVNGFLKSILPESSGKSNEDVGILLFNSFILLSIFATVAALTVFLLHKPFSSILLNGNPVYMPAALAGYILFNSPSLLIEYVYLLNNRPKSIISYGLIIFFIQIVIVGVPPFLGYGLNTILMGLFFFSALKFCWLLVVLKKYARPVFMPKIIKTLIIAGLPLVLSMLLSSSAKYIDGFIITSKFTPEDFAIFQYGARELPLALLMANSLGMAMLPRFAGKNIDSPLAELRSEVSRLTWFLFPVSVVLLLSSHWLYPLVFNPQFEASATIFNIYLLLVISRVLFPQTILISKKINRTIVRASLFEVIINAGFSIFLANKIGMVGVAYATFIAYLLEKIYLVIALKRKFGITPGKYLPLKVYFISSFFLIATFILVEFILY
ncbi:MAG: oligosaccharide flippase family protein [Prolixibacteraceae bacterium]|nr:oligosaccharide flippase family protein [Prolixibacteraceae bacterium]